MFCLCDYVSITRLLIRYNSTVRSLDFQPVSPINLTQTGMGRKPYFVRIFDVHTSRYYPSSTLFNFSDRTGTCVFDAIKRLIVFSVGTKLNTLSLVCTWKCRTIFPKCGRVGKLWPDMSPYSFSSMLSLDKPIEIICGLWETWNKLSNCFTNSVPAFRLTSHSIVLVRTSMYKTHVPDHMFNIMSSNVRMTDLMFLKIQKISDWIFPNIGIRTVMPPNVTWITDVGHVTGSSLPLPSQRLVNKYRKWRGHPVYFVPTFCDTQL